MRAYAHRKLRYRLDFNWMTGITADRWVRLLATERMDLSYAHRVAFITALSFANSAMALLSEAVTATRVRAAKVQTPLFVLGHWRQGTTHLHNLLCLDESFTYPNTYQVTCPRHFLLTERYLGATMGALLPPVRPQDGMAIGSHLPQEEEYAIALESLVSPHLAVVFPRSAARYRGHLALRGVSAQEEAAWTDAFLRFLQRQAARDPRPLVLKSPAHTARVSRLLRLFPDAKFVHIHRNPYEVFQSMRRLLETTGGFQHLQEPTFDDEALDTWILDTYQDLYDAWFEERGLIPLDQRSEVRFDHLAADPIATLRQVYTELGLPGFPQVEPRIATAVADLAGYQRNTFAPLTEAERARVANRWARSFEAWGYPP